MIISFDRGSRTRGSGTLQAKEGEVRRSREEEKKEGKSIYVIKDTLMFSPSHEMDLKVVIV